MLYTSVLVFIIANIKLKTNTQNYLTLYEKLAQRGLFVSNVEGHRTLSQDHDAKTAFHKLSKSTGPLLVSSCVLWNTEVSGIVDRAKLQFQLDTHFCKNQCFHTVCRFIGFELPLHVATGQPR